VRERILARIAAINGPDEPDARGIIAGRLDALAARNREINGAPEPDSCPAHKSGPGEEVDQGTKYSP
jgi:hypothetical protein